MGTLVCSAAREQEVSLRSHPVFINFWPLGSQSWDCYEVYYTGLNLYDCWDMIQLNVSDLNNIYT